ncbi:MAG: hypothetical protein SFZ23_02995 [Planctomycetota bacterium]|nr:hypothetical protein [Planctomycetota bacterium]
MSPTATQLRRRRGSIYFIVLVSTLLVMGMALAGIDSARGHGREADARIEAARAHWLARASLEHAFGVLNTGSSWRATAQALNGQLTDATLDRASVRVVAVDPIDGDLTDNIAEPVVLTSTVALGDAVRMLQVTANPRYTPVGCLLSTLHSHANITFTSSTVEGDGLAFAGGAASASLASVKIRVLAVGAVSGGSYQRGLLADADARSMPANNLFATYAAGARVITFNSIPGGRLELAVLSPGLNPYGTASTNGVYLIDTRGATLIIRNARIAATLVVIGNVRLEDSVSFQPPGAALPSLLVAGTLEIRTSSTSLSESTLARNFNPANAPFAGVSDTDQLDTYPSELRGLFYASGTTTLDGSVRIIGLLIATANLEVRQSASFTYDPAYAANPPAGFRERLLFEPERGSWAQTVR